MSCPLTHRQNPYVLQVGAPDAPQTAAAPETVAEATKNILNHDATLVYNDLNTLSNTIADHAKDILYETLKKSFANPSVSYSLHKLSSSPGVLAENHAVPYSDNKCVHQFIRSFLHMHDDQLHALIIAYMRLHYDIISDADAFTALVFALQREITVCFNCSESWDIALLRESLMHHNFESVHKHPIYQHTVLMALHYGLKSLGLHIVWIEWIANWKNMMKLLYAKHSPLMSMYNPEAKIKCFSQSKIDRLFQMNYFGKRKSFPSVKQCLSYCAELMFGCKIVKNEQGIWILDNPLDATHELNLGITKTHPRFNFAKPIDKDRYDVMKPGRLWKVKDVYAAQFDGFLDQPDQKLKFGFNAQHLVVMDCNQFLVEYTPDMHDKVLRSHKITEYHEEVPLYRPTWNGTRKTYKTFRIETRKFLHVGPNISEVVKRIWYTRRVWVQKLFDMETAKNTQEFYGKNDTEIIDQFKALGYDEKYSAADNDSFQDVFENILNYIKWIRICILNQWWNVDHLRSDHHGDVHKFAGRFARIVYQVFTVDTIWREVEKQFLKEAEELIENIPATNYDPPDPPKCEARALQTQIGSYFQNTIMKIDAHIKGSHLDNHKTSVMMNFLVRKWLYDIDDIGPHPLKYTIKSNQQQEQQAAQIAAMPLTGTQFFEKLTNLSRKTQILTILNILKRNLKLQWTTEQKFYNGPETSFTYIWTCPYTPPGLDFNPKESKWLEILHNKVMTLTSHMGVSETFITALAERIRTRYTDNLPHFLSFEPDAHTCLITTIDEVMQNMMNPTDNSSLRSYVFDLQSMLSANKHTEWVKFEGKTDQSTQLNTYLSLIDQESYNSLFSFIPQNLVAIMHYIKAAKIEVFNRLSRAYDPLARPRGYLTESTWIRDIETIDSQPSHTDDTHGVATNMPFTFQTHVRGTVSEDIEAGKEVIYNPSCQLNQTDVWAQIQFRFEVVKVPGDGDCLFHSIFVADPRFHTAAYDEKVKFAENLRVQVVEALRKKCNDNSIMIATDDNSYFQTYEDYTLDVMPPEFNRNIDVYLTELKKPRGIYADLSMIKLIPDIIGRTLIVYQRKRGKPPAMTGLLIFLELHGIGDEDQLNQLRACESIADFEIVFRGVKTKVGHDLLDKPHVNSVQTQALKWCQAWIDRNKKEGKNVNVWSNNIRHDRPPLWRQRKTTDEEDEFDTEYKQSVEFYGKMSMEEANETERWWPGFLLSDSLRGCEELLLNELTQDIPYLPSSGVVCTNIEPVRVLYNGQNHYEALVFTSSQDTQRTQWLRDKISVMAEQGLQLVPVDSANKDESVEAPLANSTDTESYTAESFDMEVSHLFEVEQMGVLNDEQIQHVADALPFNDVSPQTTPEFWADMDEWAMDFNVLPEIYFASSRGTKHLQRNVKGPRARQVTIIDDFKQRVVEWNKPSKKNAAMSNAKYFLYLLYSDVKSLFNTQTYDFIKEHVDAITRHDMDSQYNFAGKAIAPEKQQNKQLAQQVKDAVQWMGDDNLKALWKNHKDEVNEILSEVLASTGRKNDKSAKPSEAVESEQASETAKYENSSKAAKSENSSKAAKSERVIANEPSTEDKSSSGKNSHSSRAVTQQDVDEVLARMKKKQSAQMQKQGDTRDVGTKHASPDDGDTSGGGGGIGFADSGGFEWVPSPRNKNKGNGGTHGEKDGKDRNNRQHGHAKMLEAAARRAEAAKTPTSKPRNNQAAEMCITNIYLVKQAAAPGASRHVAVVPELTLPVRPAHETRLAMDYNSGGRNYGAGSSCAKYAV
jgi:hypothetical protein